VTGEEEAKRGAKSEHQSGPNQVDKRSSPAKAASSFFKINQKAVVINDTELGMILCRRKANGIAARALITAGSGHKYWSAYTPSVQQEIERIAEQVNSSLFTPIYEVPIKTLDLPVAGHAYSPENKKLVWDLVNYVNDVKPEMWREDPPKKRKAAAEDRSKALDDDPDGQETLRFLKRVRHISIQISNKEHGSLGLHPNVYFWSSTGKVQPTAVLGTVAFVRELDTRRAFVKFTDARYRFEEFLLRYRHFVNQIARNYGSGTRGLKALVSMYQIMLASITEGMEDQKIVEAIQAEPSLKFIREITEEDRSSGRNFSSETKSAVFIREALQKALRCSECNARLHFKSISIDHDIRKQDGGLGEVDNGLLTHPYCNQGYKEARHAKALKDQVAEDKGETTD
jgi:hypothetical protein